MIAEGHNYTHLAPKSGQIRGAKEEYPPIDCESVKR